MREDRGESDLGKDFGEALEDLFLVKLVLVEGQAEGQRNENEQSARLSILDNDRAEKREEKCTHPSMSFLTDLSDL